MFEPKRLHPVAMLVKMVKSIKEIIAALIVLVVTNFGNFRFLLIVGTAIGAVFIIILSILHWLKFTYRLEENEFRVEQGVFLKKKRYVPFERIQSINISAGIIQRLFGVVNLKIETAGGMGEAEIELSAISKEEADRIQRIIKEQKNQIQEESAVPTDLQEGKLLYKINLKELLITAATSGGLGVALSIVAFLSQFDEIIPYEKIFEQLEWITHASLTVIVFVCLLGLLLAWVLSFIGVLLKYGDFTIREESGQIIISRGILERKQFTIPIDRIQAIKISENLLRQPLGYAAVHIETAGGGDEKDIETVLFPLIRKSQLKEKIESILDVTIQQQLNPIPKRALYRLWLQDFFLDLIVIVPLCLFLKPWGYLSLLLIPISFILGYGQYKDSGWLINGNELTLSCRLINKITVVLEKKRIQSLKIKQSYFQRRRKLVSVEANFISGSLGNDVTVDNLDQNDGMKIYHWFSRREKNVL